jgi:hypothetical protein
VRVDGVRVSPFVRETVALELEMGRVKLQGTPYVPVGFLQKECHGSVGAREEDERRRVIPGTCSAAVVDGTVLGAGRQNQRLGSGPSRRG